MLWLTPSNPAPKLATPAHRRCLNRPISVPVVPSVVPVVAPTKTTPLRTQKINISLRNGEKNARCSHHNASRSLIPVPFRCYQRNQCWMKRNPSWTGMVRWNLVVSNFTLHHTIALPMVFLVVTEHLHSSAVEHTGSQWLDLERNHLFYSYQIQKIMISYAMFYYVNRTAIKSLGRSFQCHTTAIQTTQHYSFTRKPVRSCLNQSWLLKVSSFQHSLFW